MKNNNQQSIKEVLKDLVETYRLKSKLTQNKIRSIWANAMGPSIARYTKDIILRRNKIYITIESAPLRNELSFGKDKILKILNEELGEETIQEVVIR